MGRLIYSGIGSLDGFSHRRAAHNDGTAIVAVVLQDGALVPRVGLQFIGPHHLDIADGAEDQGKHCDGRHP